MLSLYAILAAAALMALSGLPPCLAPRRSRAAQAASAALMCSGGIVGLAGLAAHFASGGALASLRLGWTLPWGSLSLALDPLSGFFLALVFVVPPLGSVFALEYWDHAQRPRSGARLSLAYGLLAGAMAIVLVARDGVLFLIAWEIMALAAYFAATASDEGRALRRSGWIYLIATHAGTLLLFAMFALLNRATGSFSLAAAPSLPAATADAIFALALLGFGFKAGLAPLHFWLPGAHASAPSHVSATMSGVMLKMGVYGILRMSSLMPTPPAWWGWTLMAVGAAGGLAGILFAIGQSDIKRILAYSSVENVGIVSMGAGLALLGASLGRWELVLLGSCGALLHAWNHGLFKGLLFLGSGAVAHATGTREIERLGGLAKSMPKLAALFLLGSVAACALPPLNGFAGEWLLYLGFFGAIGSGAAGSALGATTGAGAAPAVAAAGAVVLATIGALALACFVRLYGGVFTGAPRSLPEGGRGSAAARARDPGLAMLLPPAILAGLCLLLGLAPVIAFPAVEMAARSWAERLAPFATALSLRDAAPSGWISAAGVAVLALAAALYAALRSARGRAAATAAGAAVNAAAGARAGAAASATTGARAGAAVNGAAATAAATATSAAAATAAAAARPLPTWDCGYARPTARMQYTASSFGDTILSLFLSVLRPGKRRPSLRGAFPEPARYEEALPDAILDRVVMPAAGAIDRVLPRFRVFQRGQTQLYVLYVVVVAIALFAFGGLGVMP